MKGKIQIGRIYIHYKFLAKEFYQEYNIGKKLLPINNTKKFNFEMAKGKTKTAKRQNRYFKQEGIQMANKMRDLDERSHLYTTTRKATALTRQTFVSKVISLLFIYLFFMSLLFNMLSRLVIAFLPRRKRLLISWLQSPSAVILESKKIKVCHCFHCFPIYLP